MRIGIDLDEVVFNFVDPMLETVNIKEGSSWTRSNVTEYSLENSGIFKPGTNKEWLETFRNYYGFQNLPLMPDAKLLGHIPIEHEIIFVTSRDPKDMPASYEALKKHILLFGPILYCANNLTKLDIVRQLDIKVLVDDCPAHLNPVTLESDCWTILFSNIDHSIRNGKWNYHARNWERVVQIIQNL